MQAWIENNKNKDSIDAINKIVRAIAESTNYDDFREVMINSVLVRSLFKAREMLYWEGLRCQDV
jgi:hypothetical protein